MTDLPPELLPQGPQPQGPQGPTKPPSPDAELANEFGAMLAEDAQGQDEQLQEDFQWFMQTSYEDSMRAKGFGENLKFGAASVGKTFGDGVSSLLGFAFKSGSSVAAGLSGDGFGHGWDVGAKGLEQGTGSTDPGVVDYSVAIGDIMGLTEREEGVNYGAQADADLRLRLGRAALATETAGFLASFAIGPGAAVGRGGARAVDVIGSPVAKLMAKPAERAIAKMATTSAEAAQEMIDSGKAWQVLTSTDKWKKSVSMTERSMAWGGRTFQDMLSMTGANVAQSYAMAKDDERMAHLATAAWTSPFMVPISRMGQKISGLVATKGMKRPDAEWLQDAMAKIESGKMTVPQLHKKLWKHANPAMRAAGNMIASSVEGSMFLGLDPHAWELFAKYRAGDMDALADLQAMALGSITGLAVVKGVTPVDLAPMFKRLAPEFNTLSSHIEAETNRRSANDETLNSVVAKVAKDAVPPQDPRGGSAAGEKFGIKVTKGLSQKDQRTLLAEKQGREKADAELWGNAEVAGPTGEMARKMAAVEQDTRAKFGWAEEATTGLLRGGWEPSFSTDGSGDVHLSFGRDHNLTLTQDAGDVSLVLTPEHVQMLRDVDGLPGDPTVESPNRQRLTGDAAREALHNLSLLSVVRQQEFALNAERIGMDEVMPGVYATPGEGIHHYVQLDGSIVQRSAVDGTWISGKSDMQVVGQPGEPVWNHPNADLLADTLIAKRAMSPDLLVDNALSQSIALARYGRGASADELRAFLETLTPEQIQQAMTPAADDFLAFDLGSLGSGTNNAHNLMMERHSKSLDRQVGGEEMAADGLGAADPAVPQQEFTRAMEGKDTSTAEALQGSLSKRLQGVRDAEHNEYREALTEASDVDAAKHTEAATKKARWEGIQEEIHRRIFPEQRAKLEPDPLPQDKAHGGIPMDDVKVISRAAGKGVGKTVDFIARDMADVLQRKGVEFGPRLKKVRSKSGEIEGRALEHSAKLQELQKDPTHKEEFAKLLGEYHPIGKSETMQRSRFEDLVNGRVEPETPLERIVVEEGQAFTGSLRDAASDAGSFRAKKDKDGNTYHEPVVKGGKTSTPYVEGRDMHKVMDSPKLRKAFFDELAQHNELYRDGKRLTGDDLVDDWVKREKPSGESSNAKKKAAVEFSRKFHNYPEVWKHEGKTYEIQEANPWNRHHRIAQQESGRAAMDAEFGVGGGDMDAKALRTKGQAEGWEKQHLDALEKGGLQAEIDRTHEHHLRHSDKAEADSIRDAMDLLAARAQGAEIVDGLVKNPGASRFWAGLQALRSSALSSLSFLRDIPDLARGAQFTGARRLFKATTALAGDTKEFTRILERDGVLMRQMGDWIYQEARGLFRGAADRIGWAAQKTERAKAILAAKQVELMIKDVNAGRGTDMDSYFIESLLGIDVAGQKIEGDLRVQVMREGTEFLTSRARKGTYSKFADDPRTSQLLLFPEVRDQASRVPHQGLRERVRDGEGARLDVEAERLRTQDSGKDGARRHRGRRHG